MQHQARVGCSGGSRIDRVTTERWAARRPEAVAARRDAAHRVRRLERALGWKQSPMGELTAMRTLELGMLLARLERAARAEGFSIEGTLFA